MDTSGSMASMDFSGFPLPIPVDGCQSDADCNNGEVCCEDLLFGGEPSCGEPSPLCVPPGSGSGGFLEGLDQVTCVCGEGNCEAMKGAAGNWQIFWLVLLLHPASEGLGVLGSKGLFLLPAPGTGIQ